MLSYCQFEWEKMTRNHFLCSELGVSEFFISKSSECVHLAEAVFPHLIKLYELQMGKHMTCSVILQRQIGEE